MQRWRQFIVERFEPISHVLMIFGFFGANILLGYYLNIENSEEFVVSWQLLPVFVIVLLMFFHLRLFDEIKDYAVDCQVNKGRPLARGLIGLREFKIVTVGVVVLEILLAGLFLKLPAVLTALVMIGYSLLMFKEFFCGAWLRPKMELYALTHTLVAGFMAWFLVAAITDQYWWQFALGHGYLFLLNWFMFNIFEFSRKTFSRIEERPGVESYSQRLGSLGAVLLTLINVGGVWGSVMLMRGPFEDVKRMTTVAVLIVILGVLPYVVRQSLRTVRLFRAICAAFLVVFNLLIIVILFWQQGFIL